MRPEITIQQVMDDLNISYSVEEIIKNLIGTVRPKSNDAVLQEHLATFCIEKHLENYFIIRNVRMSSYKRFLAQLKNNIFFDRYEPNFFRYISFHDEVLKEREKIQLKIKKLFSEKTIIFGDFFDLRWQFPDGYSPVKRSSESFSGRNRTNFFVSLANDKNISLNRERSSRVAFCGSVDIDLDAIENSPVDQARNLAVPRKK